VKILITGGLGFIGSNFVRHILKSDGGVSIVNLDLKTYAGNPANLAEFSGNSRYRWVKGDIADPKAVARAMKGCVAVVHFAAESHVDRSILDPGPFLRTNVIGTQVLLDAARAEKVKRFIHVSTDEVYGSIEGSHLSTEKDPLFPNSPYAASKAASDHLARAAFVTHGLPVIITRASNNFGPYQFPEKALPLMITNFLEGRAYPLYGDGLNVRDWLYVLDHVAAIAYLLKKGAPGEIYNIGGGSSLKNKELVVQVRKVMNVPESLVERVADRLGHDKRYALDDTKLRRLGFKFKYPFARALESTIAWYKDHPSWWRPLKKSGSYQSYYGKQYKK
jgi:dTDP-glucose 4,6-dehydratase